MSRLIVTADHSCEFSQRHGSLIDTDGEQKKSSTRAAEFLQFSVRLSDSPVRMNLLGRRSADGCPDG